MSPAGQGCGQPGRNEWGQCPPPPLQGHRYARELQSPCLAAYERGLEGNAGTIHELTFCYYLVLSPACSWLVWAVGGAAGPSGARGRES